MTGPGLFAKAGAHAVAWVAVLSSGQADAELARELAGASIKSPHDGGLHNALGVIEQPGNAAVAAGHFGRAADSDLQNVMAGLNLAEALAVCGKREAAIEQARRTVAAVDAIAAVERGFFHDRKYLPYTQPAAPGLNWPFLPGPLPARPAGEIVRQAKSTCPSSPRPLPACPAGEAVRQQPADELVHLPDQPAGVRRDQGYREKAKAYEAPAGVALAGAAGCGSGAGEGLAGAAGYGCGRSTAFSSWLVPVWMDAPHFPTGFDFFRVEWERAGWRYADCRSGRRKPNFGW
jgi:hypothetical protein